MDDIVYRQYAESFEDHWWTDHRRRIFSRWLSAAGVNQTGMYRVLEIGSGAGTEQKWMSGYGPVTGVELSPAGLEFCATRGYAELIQGDLNTLELPADSFDLSVDFHVLYHGWVTEPGKVLSKLAAATRPGGWLLLTEPAHEYLRRGHDRAVLAKRRWSRSELLRLVDDAGFEVVHCSAFLTILLPVVWLSMAMDILRSQREVSELAPPKPWVDRCLRRVMAIERGLMRLMPLPTGTCWAVLARLPRERIAAGSPAVSLRSGYGSSEVGAMPEGAKVQNRCPT